jgi:membrane fusion protein, multidrug efflux system
MSAVSLQGPQTSAPNKLQTGWFARLWPWALAGLVVLGFTGVTTWRIVAPRPDVWTDNAYVRVHYAAIAPRVAGQVTEVRVQNDDVVKAGQVWMAVQIRVNPAPG